MSVYYWSLSQFSSRKKSEALTICLQECMCERAHVIRVFTFKINE